MYPALTAGAAETIAHFGSAEQKQRYLEPMYSGRFAGTMCLTEPDAGSDVGASRTRASRNPDGTYSVSGSKLFITGGDHDLAENVVHLVLARVDGAPAGTKGLSLLIVPKIRVAADGSLGRPTTSRSRASRRRWACTARRPASSPSATREGAWASWSARRRTRACRRCSS
jgi:alkylation response protein AidB-like acyl-CoA dehydrogenase